MKNGSEYFEDAEKLIGGIINPFEVLSLARFLWEVDFEKENKEKEKDKKAN